MYSTAVLKIDSASKIRANWLKISRNPAIFGQNSANFRQFTHINFNLFHYAGNNPVKYVDPDGRMTFNYGKFFQQQIYAEMCVIDAGVRDFFGKVTNTIVNVFTGNASYQAYAKASLSIFNFDCNIFDLKIGSEGQNLSFAVDQKATGDVLEAFEQLSGAPLVFTNNKVKFDVAGVNFTLQTDGTTLKVNANVGKKKSFNLGALGEGKLNLCAGINISTNMDDGPAGTMKNEKSTEIENDKANYNYYKSPGRLFEIIE